MNDDSLDRHIHLIYNTVMNPSEWINCLEDISATINAKAGMIGMDDDQSKTHLTSIRHGFSEDAIKALMPYHAKCLWTHKLIELNPQRFITSEQLLEQKRYLASELFDGFGRYFDSYYATGMYFDQNGTQALRMSFLRGRSQGAFGPTETNYLNRLLPHIRRALSLSRKMLEQTFLVQVSEHTSNATNSMQFIVNSSNKVLNINHCASMNLINSKWFDIFQNKLIFKTGVSNRDYHAALSSVTRDERFIDMPPTIPFLVEIDQKTHKESYLVEVSRFQTNIQSEFSQITTIKSEVLAMVTIQALSKKPQNLSVKLKQLFQLSESESEIALYLANGSAPKQIAEERCRSIETVRTQIKKIMMKLDANSASHLVAIINQLKN